MRIEYLVAVYGYLQLSMQDVGLLNSDGSPINRRRRRHSEEDALSLYKWVAEQLKGVGIGKVRRLAGVSNDKVRKLINDEQTVNNFLLGVLLLRCYVDDSAKYEQILLSPKINRLISVLDEAVTDEAVDASIRRTTSRVADNLYRMSVGKCQIGDDCRDLRFKRIVK